MFLTLSACAGCTTDPIPLTGTDTQEISLHTVNQSETAEPALYEWGLRQEAAGNIADAMTSFYAAANMGYTPAMKKLTQIYDKGNSVVPRNYASAIKWYHRAREAGTIFPSPLKR